MGNDGLKIAITYICTGNYSIFWDQFFRSCEKYFLAGVEKQYYVFTDQVIHHESCSQVHKISQKNPGWPGNALKRFHMLSKIRDQLQEYDYIFFFNANCRIIRPIGASILPSDEEGLLVVQHPGFYNKQIDDYTYDRNPSSSAYIAPGRGKHYVAGGFNGGTRTAFTKFIDTAKKAVELDEKNGQVALWHDESHLNRYILDHPYRLEHAGYLYPEGWNLPFRKMVEVLDKNRFGGHEAMRSLIPTAFAVSERLAGRDKVICHIYGGLGNQMFQYACARSLALRNGADVVLDQREFFAGAGQKPGLHHLNIVSASVPERKLPPTKKQWFRYLFWRHLKLPPRMVRQKGDHFNPDITKLSGQVWLHGYWQSEKYFGDFEDQIRTELTVKTPPDEKNRNLLTEIGRLPAVSLHIRRGDYVNNPQANAAHGTCTLEYYRSAALLMAERMSETPVFFVFSDEPEWAKANLDLPFEIRVMDHNDSDHNYEDLRLMAACRHHVIANSTFSWWGAWLNPSKEKIVIAPQQWFADPSLINPDILPPSWIALQK